MERSARSSMYAAHLAAEQLAPTVGSDGHIRFKHEGKSLFILVDEQDEEYFRMIMPGIWEIDDERERVAVEHACVEVSARLKVAKVFPVDSSVWCCVELFVTPPEAFKAVFTRSAQVLDAAAQQFAIEMLKRRDGE